MLAHQVFGLTDAFLLGTKPGIVMWLIMGLITGLYLKLAPERLGVTRRQGDEGTGCRGARERRRGGAGEQGR
jgi:hypothetical protein